MKGTMELYKSLDLGLKLTNNGACEVCVTEPESGIHKAFEFNYEPSEHPVFDEELGREIYSWISLWMDWFDDMEEEENESHDS